MHRHSLQLTQLCYARLLIDCQFMAPLVFTVFTVYSDVLTILHYFISHIRYFFSHRTQYGNNIFFGLV